MRKIFVAVAVLVGLWWASPARAHDPIILTSEQRTPADGPLLPDGTVSFALYGTIETPGDTRGFRVNFAAEDPLYLSILIPDLAPENVLDDASLPYLVVEDPEGNVEEIVNFERIAFAEPFTGTNYVRLSEKVGPALAGTYSITITGNAPARFTVSVGTKEMFGTPVENVPNRDLGVGGVMAWYETAPSTVVPTTSPTTTAPSTAAPSTAPETSVAVVADDPAADSDDSSVPYFLIAVAVLAVLGGVAVFRRRVS